MNRCRLIDEVSVVGNFIIYLFIYIGLKNTVRVVASILSITCLCYKPDLRPFILKNKVLKITIKKSGNSTKF